MSFLNTNSLQLLGNKLEQAIVRASSYDVVQATRNVGAGSSFVHQGRSYRALNNIVANTNVFVFQDSATKQLYAVGEESSDRVLYERTVLSRHTLPTGQQTAVQNGQLIFTDFLDIDDKLSLFGYRGRTFKTLRIEDDDTFYGSSESFVSVNNKGEVFGLVIYFAESKAYVIDKNQVVSRAAIYAGVRDFVWSDLIGRQTGNILWQPTVNDYNNADGFFYDFETKTLETSSQFILTSGEYKSSYEPIDAEVIETGYTKLVLGQPTETLNWSSKVEEITWFGTGSRSVIYQGSVKVPQIFDRSRCIYDNVSGSLYKRLAEFRRSGELTDTSETQLIDYSTDPPTISNCNAKIPAKGFSVNTGLSSLSVGQVINVSYSGEQANFNIPCSYIEYSGISAPVSGGVEWNQIESYTIEPEVSDNLTFLTSSSVPVYGCFLLSNGKYIVYKGTLTNFNYALKSLSRIVSGQSSYGINLGVMQGYVTTSTITINEIITEDLTDNESSIFIPFFSSGDTGFNTPGFMTFIIDGSFNNLYKQGGRLASSYLHAEHFYLSNYEFFGFGLEDRRGLQKFKWIDDKIWVVDTVDFNYLQNQRYYQIPRFRMEFNLTTNRYDFLFDGLERIRSYDIGRSLSTSDLDFSLESRIKI